MSKEQKTFVAGHRGMVGSAILRKLRERDPRNIVTRSRAELDLINQSDVRSFFENEQIDQVYMAAAKVGGIHANDTYPAEFIYENLMVEANIIHEAWRTGVKRLLFLGSSCIYPRMASQPMTETALLTGPLEPTNEPYAIAKITGIKLCESYNRQHGTDYRSVMPTNLYGPGDNYHPENSHVIPGLIRRFHEAKENGLSEVRVWGTGAAMREFLFVDDMAEACLHVMDLDSEIYARNTEPMLSHINIGSGQDISIRELAGMIASVVGYSGEIVLDATKPDGAPRKLMDVDRLKKLGWSAKTTLRDGLSFAYADFLANEAKP
ncbi:MAG: GDP-L-fucose synthase [Rickettsiales bacterium]|nr:GDP-L-fucose synthase [Rickettsiales bacterium]